MPTPNKQLQRTTREGTEYLTTLRPSSLFFAFAIASVSPGFAQEKSAVEYESVAHALTALQSNPDASIAKDDGWTNITLWIENGFELWLFVPRSHPAYPSVVKRTVALIPETSSHRAILCEATMSACEALTREMDERGDALRTKLKRHR